jgi:serpin B
MRGMKSGLLAGVLAGVLLVTGCGLATTPAALAKSDKPRATANPGQAATAASAVNAFGLDLLQALRAAQPTDNVVVSPASIAIALAMARAGARSDTATQMDAVLRSLGADQSAAAVNALDQALASRSGTFRDMDGKAHDLTLTVANAPFAQRDYAWQPAYLDALAERFGAAVRLVDYAADPEAARQQINAWVDDQTHQRIAQLISPGVLDELTRLVLVNAIYLKAPWQRPFGEAATKPGPFQRLDGTTIHVPMMAVQEFFPYAERQGWRAIDLPYIGNSLALTILLPTDPADFVRGLDADSFGQITAALSDQEVLLTMPRFSVETTADLGQVLSALGMPLAFDPLQADFSGMTTQEQLYIAAVVHQANISVDEKGTEAAAATAVVMAAGAAPLGPIELSVDRPFLFALRDRPTGAVLFLGQVTTPSEADAAAQ